MLHPNKVKNREGFFLHLDVKGDGTSGCIGVNPGDEGKFNQMMALIMRIRDDLPVEVSYLTQETKPKESQTKKKKKKPKLQKPEFVKFTFDDGPRPETDTILSTLDEHSIRAGFFITGPGNGAKMHKVQSIIDAKHVVGNHTWDHSHKPEMFEKLHNYILRKNKYKMTYWRGPGGSTSGLTKIANTLGYQKEDTHWEFEPLDHKGLSAEQIIEKRIMKGGRGRGPKGVLLLHDRHAAKFLPTLISKLVARDIAIRDFP